MIKVMQPELAKKLTKRQKNIVLVTNEYDEFNRAIKQTFPDGGQMLYSYDDAALTTTLTEQNGKTFKLSMINTKNSLFNYLNSGYSEQITQMLIFAHGLPTSPILSLGYNSSNSTKLDIGIADLSANIKKDGFAPNFFTVFFSCNAGTVFNNNSFAQEWSNISSEIKAGVCKLLP